MLGEGAAVSCLITEELTGSRSQTLPASTTTILPEGPACAMPHHRTPESPTKGGRGRHAHPS